MKKIILSLFFYLVFSINFVFSAENSVHLVSGGLPSKKEGKKSGEEFMSRTIEEFIQIVAVLAVFALIFSGIYYLISAGNEEKTGKAKKWIIWSLVGVFLSFTSWGIINWLNNININF